MKQKIYLLGLATVILISLGIVFKINHWPGAGYMLIAGFLSLIFLFIPAALRENFRSNGSKYSILYIVTWITCLVVFGGMLFKLMHWPYAGTLLFIALPFPYVVFLPVFLVVTGRIKNYNIYNTVSVLILLAFVSVFSALLSLSVTKTRIDDSLGIARGYMATGMILREKPANNPESTVNMGIDNALKIIDDYLLVIIGTENTKKELLTSYIGAITGLESQGAAAKYLEASGENPVGARLEASLKNLIGILEKTDGYQDLARVAPDLFDFRDAGPEEGWSYRIFRNQSLVWTITYLEGLKTSLLTIKTTK